MSIKGISASTPVPVDLVDRIGIDGVNEILAVLWMGYRALKSDPHIYVTATSEEDDITCEWFIKIQRIWDSRNRATCVCLNSLVPHHQYPDNTLKSAKGKKAPTIDFCFRDWSAANSYFGAECKNLYANRPERIKRYIETGILNYTSGKYGSQSTQSSIIGYVLSGEIFDIVDQIRKQLDKESPVSNLARTLLVSEPQYRSIHNRKLDRVNITIHHLFFDFT